MGMNIFGSSSDSKESLPCNQQINLRDYTIQKYEIIAGFPFLTIKYHNATNYEGIKILVFNKGITLEKILKNQKLIDPHFNEDKYYYSPILRIEPKKEIIDMIKDMLIYYEGDKYV